MNTESAITFVTVALGVLCVIAYFQSPSWKTGTRAVLAAASAYKALN
jgi:hypothetical protein